MPEIETGDPYLDLVLEAGPRAFGPDTPEHVRKEIATSQSLHWYKLHLAVAAANVREQAKAEVRQIGRENQQMRYKSVDGLGLPYCRLPRTAIAIGEQLIGPKWWTDDKELESFLDEYPECRIKVKYGTKGQEY